MAMPLSSVAAELFIPLHATVGCQICRFTQREITASLLPRPTSPDRMRGTAVKLYHRSLSGHAHRARLFLSLVGAPCEIVEVHLAKGEHNSPDFLKLNPFGQVPVL